MKQTVTRKDLKRLSLEFRSAASRLIRTNFRDAFGNLKRFLTFLESSPILSSYLFSLPRVEVDYKAAISDRRHYSDPLEIPTDPREEAAYIFGLFNYIVANNLDLDHVSHGYGSGSRLQDHMDGFNHRVTSPFVGFLEHHIQTLMLEAGMEDADSVTINVSAPVQQLNFANHSSTISAVNLNTMARHLLSNADQLLHCLENESIDSARKTEMKEMIALTKEHAGCEPPKKSIIKLATEKLSSLANGIKLTHETYQAIEALIKAAKDIAG